MRVEMTDDDLLHAAIDHLPPLPGVQLDWLPGASPDGGVDRVLHVRTPAGETEYAIHVKRTLSLSALGAVLAHIEASRPTTGRPVLLVTAHAPPALSRRLVAADQPFLDASGNAYLRGDAMYVLREGQPRRREIASERSPFTPAGLKVVFALLRDKALRGATYRAISEAAGVSLGSVSLTMRGLASEGHVTRHQGTLRLVDFDDLLARWELGYAERLRSKLRIGRFELPPGRSLQDLQDHLRRSGAPAHFIGGELGGAILTGHLRPETAAIHTPLTRRELMVDLRLRPSEKGNITSYSLLAPAIGAPHGSGLPLADPILIRAELLADGADRLRDIAQIILTQHIAPREEA